MIISFLKLDTAKTYSIDIDDQKVKYQIKINPRSRNIRLSIQSNGIVTVSVPKRVTIKEIEIALIRHKRWLLKRLENEQKGPPFKFKNDEKLPLFDNSFRLLIDYSPDKNGYWETKNSTLNVLIPQSTDEWIYNCVKSWYREMAKQFLEKRIPFWADKMNLKFNRFLVKNQRTVWGSCSKKKNLNFNWRMMLLNEKEADYLIIHELAHLQEMNHSVRFWNVVEKYCADYRVLRKRVGDKGYLLKFPSF